MSSSMTPGEFKAYRKKLRYSRIELAELLGKHYLSIGRYERGSIVVPRAVVLALQTLPVKRIKRIKK